MAENNWGSSMSQLTKKNNSVTDAERFLNALPPAKIWVTFR
jgi:hypothetical protein